MKKDNTYHSLLTLAFVMAGCVVGTFLGMAFRPTYQSKGTAHVIYLDGNTATCDRETFEFIAGLVKQDPKKKVQTIVEVGK